MEHTRDRWIVDGVLGERDRGFAATLLRAALTPLAWLHVAGLETYLLPYRLGVRKQFRLPVPVVSIGNLSSGGTGKTPTTVSVATHLQSMGKRVVVLSRGHGGTGEKQNEPRIVSDGTTTFLTPAEAGDEPVLLASLLPGVPVIVCRDRRKSGKLAVETFAPDVIVLDDGMQFWQLFRDLDIVLLDARAPFGSGHVLPRGVLREPPAHLSRAGVVILTRADRVGADVLAQNMAQVAARTRPGVPVLTATHAPVGWTIPGSADNDISPTSLAGCVAVVVSGIADGAAFAQTVKDLRVVVKQVLSLGDHHAYTTDDVALLSAASTKVGYIVTTEKDLVKLQTVPGAEALPLAALRITLRVDGDAALHERLAGLFDAALAPVKGD